jgi:hypothetical protein
VSVCEIGALLRGAQLHFAGVRIQHGKPMVFGKIPFSAKPQISTRNSVRSWLDALLTLPLVLPPAVAGYFLLLIFCRRSPQPWQIQFDPESLLLLDESHRSTWGLVTQFPKPRPQLPVSS